MFILFIFVNYSNSQHLVIEQESLVLKEPSKRNKKILIKIFLKHLRTSVI